MAAKHPPRRQFGSIRKLPSGRYQARYEVSGRSFSAPNTFSARDYAEGWLAQERRALDLGTWVHPDARADTVAEQVRTAEKQALTFGDWANAFMAERTDPGHEAPIRPTTAKDYETQLRLRLLPAFGTMKLTDITPEHVAAWYRRVGVRKTSGKGGPRARAKSYSALLAILNAAVADSRTALTENPCRVRGAGRTGNTRNVEMLDPTQIAALADAMPERLRLAVLFAAWLGTRYGETMELRRSDVRLEGDRGTIHVRRAVSWTAGAVHIGKPKTDAGTRRIAVPPHILDDVRRHLDRFAQPARNGLLFPSPTGGNLRASSFEIPWHKARSAIGRDDLTFHDLRHVALTLAAQSGATTRETMVRGGHRDHRVAMRYQESAADRDQQIAARLSAMIEEGK